MNITDRCPNLRVSAACGYISSELNSLTFHKTVNFNGKDLGGETGRKETAGET